MQRSSVVRNVEALTKPAAQRLLASAALRIVSEHGKEAVAEAMGCSTRTVEKMLALDTLPELEKAVNLLRLDTSALDGLLAHLGLKLVPLEASSAADARLLADITKLGATVANAMADGHIDHVEEQVIAADARPVVRELAGRIAVADRKRAA